MKAKIYEAFIFKVNALDVLVKVPHYFGFLKYKNR